MEQYLSIREAAERLCVSDKTIRRRVQSGELPHVRLGRCIRISEKTLNDALIPGYKPQAHANNRNIVTRI